MENVLELQVVTPERQVLSRPVQDVVLPSAMGYMGVLPGHAPLLAKLEIGELRYRAEGHERVIAVSGGYAEVLPDSVTVLARTAEPAEEIDAERARHAKQRAEEKLKRSDSDFSRARVSLQRAVNRIDVHARRGT